MMIETLNQLESIRCNIRGQANILQATINDRLSAGTEIPEDAVQEVAAMLTATAKGLLAECDELDETLDELRETETFDA